MVSKKLRARAAKPSGRPPIPAGPPPPAPMKRSDSASDSSLSSLDSSPTSSGSEYMPEIEPDLPVAVAAPAPVANRVVPTPQQRPTRLAPPSTPVSAATSAPTSVPLRRPAPVTEGERFLEKYDGDVTRGKWNPNKQSPLISLPRTIRNRIYACLLYNTTSAASKKINDSYRALANSQYRERTVQVQLDMLKDHSNINPDGPDPCSAISQNMGLLLSCKQLHTEANAFIYTHNVFTIRVREDKEQCFWHCHPNDPRCIPYLPCLVHVRNLRQIKHLYIMAYNPHDFSDRAHDLAARNISMNLRLVSRCFRVLGLKLKTLKVMYMSRLEGQTDAVRKMMDTQPRPGKKPKTLILKSVGGGRGYMFKQGGSPTEIFKNVGVLDALRLMRGCAEKVIIRGDLPTAYLKEIRTMLTVGEGMKAETEDTSMLQDDNCDADDEDHAQDDEKPTLWQDLDVQHRQDPVAKELCKQVKGRPIYSPAVLREMFGRPTDQQVKALSRWRPS